MMNFVSVLAVLSGIAQAVGYLAYLQLVVKRQIRANALSWLMFAYGGLAITAVQYAVGAGWQELLLPAICALMAIATAFLSFRIEMTSRGGLNITAAHRTDVAAFVADVVLTICFVAVNLLAIADAIPSHYATLGNAAVLICLNATIITSFTPIVRTTWQMPEREHPFPWAIWSAAYALLLVTTLSGSAAKESPLLILYPSICLIFHITVGVFSLRRRPGSLVNLHGNVFVVNPAGRKGLGLFTSTGIKQGGTVFHMTGRLVHYVSRSAFDAHYKEDYMGLDADTWLDPDPPFIFANHACDPNMGIVGVARFVALRDIAAGEEITYDYALTTNEIEWTMPCSCGSQQCRGVVRSIQFLDRETYTKRLPYIAPWFQKVYEAHHGEATSTNQRDK